MNKPKGYRMTSYNSNERQKNIKNAKKNSGIYMVILIILVAIIIMTKAKTLMKTGRKTVIRIII